MREGLFFALGRGLLRAAGDALGPAGCAACDAPTRWAVFCPACASSLVRAGPGFGSSPTAFGQFGGALAVALRRLKYAGRPDLARLLGELARRAAREAALRPDVVVPVPLHPRRLAARGYNQAALLAAAVAVEWGVPVAARALSRCRHTPQQAALDRAARLTNVAGAIEVRDPAALRGRRVLLVDDVTTTGATLDECEVALRSASPASVRSLVVARSEPGDAHPRGFNTVAPRFAAAQRQSVC